MPRTSNDRKARFRAALALTEMTAKEWAVQEGITESHLSKVLAGDRESRTLLDKIDAFAKKHVRTVAA
jgi:predicted transcriptional regulator